MQTVSLQLPATAGQARNIAAHGDLIVIESASGLLHITTSEQETMQGRTGRSVTMEKTFKSLQISSDFASDFVTLTYGRGAVRATDLTPTANPVSCQDFAGQTNSATYSFNCAGWDFAQIEATNVASGGYGGFVYGQLPSGLVVPLPNYSPVAQAPVPQFGGPFPRSTALVVDCRGCNAVTVQVGSMTPTSGSFLNFQGRLMHENPAGENVGFPEWNLVVTDLVVGTSLAPVGWLYNNSTASMLYLDSLAAVSTLTTRYVAYLTPISAAPSGFSGSVGLKNPVNGGSGLSFIGGQFSYAKTGDTIVPGSPVMGLFVSEGTAGAPSQYPVAKDPVVIPPGFGVGIYGAGSSTGAPFALAGRMAQVP